MTNSNWAITLCALSLLAAAPDAHAQAAERLRVRPVITDGLARRARAGEKPAPAPRETPRPAGRPASTARPAPRPAREAGERNAGPAPAERAPSAPPKLLGDPVRPPAADTARRLESVAVARPDSLRTPAPAAAAPSAPDTARAAKPAPAPAEDRAAERKPAPVMEVGAGKVKFSGLVQAWYMGGSSDVTSTFRVRRAEMKFAGELSPSARWTLMLDPSKALRVSNSYATVDGTRVVTDGKVTQGSLLLQDAYVSVLLGGFTLDAGQFKLPLTLEGSSVSSARLETVERSLFINEGKYGNVRDLGAMLSGPLSSDISFQVGLFNGAGEGQNSVDANDQKVAAGRLELRTALEGLRLGTSGAWSGEESDENPRRDRLGADLSFSRGPVLLRSEVMRGWDGELERRGYYALAAYRHGRKELVGRFDTWDPNTGLETAVGNVTERSYTGGLGWQLGGSNTKVQANYTYRTFADVLSARSLFLVNLQTSW